MVQWLKLQAPTAGGTGLVPGRGTKIPHAARRAWLKRKKKSSGLCEEVGAVQGDRKGWLNLPKVVATQGRERIHIRPPTLTRSLSLTVQLSLPPTLYLEGLPRKYVAAQLHLHWGQKGSPGGSEHQINGEATAAEVPGSKAWIRTQW